MKNKFSFKLSNTRDPFNASNTAKRLSENGYLVNLKATSHLGATITVTVPADKYIFENGILWLRFDYHLNEILEAMISASLTVTQSKKGENDYIGVLID